MKRLIIAVAALVSWSVGSAHPLQIHDDRIAVSVMELIATPDRFDGKLVWVTGFLDLNLEGDVLYLHREDYQNLLRQNAIWVDTTEEMGKNRAGLNTKYVRILGTFRAGPRGNDRTLVGGITQIKEAKLWSDPAHPLAESVSRMLVRDK